MREERDLYNEKLELTNKTYFKGDKIPIGYFPMVVMIAIQNSNGEFLMQKRVESKGGDWGVTGCHPKHGETPGQGIVTEVKEELEINIKGKEIIEFARGCDGKDCYIMYYTFKYLKLVIDYMHHLKFLLLLTLSSILRTSLHSVFYTCSI